MKKQIGLSVIVGLLAFCSTSYADPPFIPGSAEALGFTRIVPDTLIWYSSSLGVPKIGGLVGGDDVPVGGSVEATTGVLGDSTFLLAASTKATNDSASMSPTCVYQPAAGGTPKLDNLLHADNGVIYLQRMNESRQDGNPARIVGDPRYGAVNICGGDESSLWYYPTYFDSDHRWDHDWYAWSGGVYRQVFAQTYSLNPLSLAPTMLCKAFDVAFGRMAAAGTLQGLGADGSQLSRCGGTCVGLDNGNFVWVVEDRSRTFNPDGDASTATIFAPDGTIVTDSWKVANADQWSNVGAYRGGFYVRPSGGNFYFFDNAGNLTGTNAHNVTSGLSYDTGRGDGTRSCSDIRSHYVFFAGNASMSGTNAQVWLSAFDAKTASWIANIIVSEGTSDVLDTGGSRNLDRCNIACDANNNVTVVYKVKPDNSVFLNWQIAARVFHFDGTMFTALTPSFYPFIEHDSDTNNVVGFDSEEPSVSMTPRQILFYAEGLWNTNASPTVPPVSASQTHCYTILSHPAPIAKVRPPMTIAYGSPNSIISWQADAGLFILQSTATPEVPASWADVSPQPAITRTAYVDPTDKYQMSVPNGTGPKFYRLVRHW